MPHVLVPTDGSESAENAAILGARLSVGGSVTLLTVEPTAGMSALAALDSVSTLVAGAPGVLAEEWNRHHEREALELLAAARRRIDEVAHGELHTDHVPGRPADVVLDRLEKGRFDLAVLGTHGRGAVARAVLGSVSAEVLEHARKPVLLARGREVRHVLVGVDGSLSAARAARFAGEIARITGARLSLLFAADVERESFLKDRADLKKALEQQAAQAFAEARDVAGTGTAETLVYQDPALALVQRAEAGDADVIVVGRRGRAETTREVGRATLGKVARRVALGATRSVIVVP